MKSRHRIRQKAETSRIIQYLIAGGAWFWSGYAMFAFLYSVLSLDIVPAKVASYIFGLSVNFALERIWVFGDKSSKARINNVTLRYILLSSVNLVIDSVIVWSLSEVGISPYIGQFVSAGFFTIWNYIWYKAWVFASKKDPGPKRPAAPHLNRPKKVRHVGVKA